MAPNGYIQPRTVDELVTALAEAGGGAKILAGGTDLMIAARAGKTFETIINVSRVEGLGAITLAAGTLTVGSGVTVAQLLRSDEVRAAAPLLWQAADRFASPLVRSRATVGGNLCNASPAADLALALLAHDAEVVLVSRAGRRTLPLEHFSIGPGRTALAPGEALVGASMPARSGRWCRFDKSGTRPALEIAIASVAMALTLEGRGAGAIVVDPRICYGAVAPVVLRGRAAEAAIAGRALEPDVIADAVQAAVAEIRPIDDLRATAVYRRRLVAAFVRRCLGRPRPTPPAPRATSAERGISMPRLVEIRFTLNGRPVHASVAPTMALLELVRDRFQLTGSKLGCGEGECGACAMLLDGEPVLGCLTPAVDADARSVRTVEDLKEDGKLGALQQAFLHEGAVQCGFCTPGMLVAATALLAEQPHPTREQITRGLEGNLCRCTGYVAIVEAVEKAAEAAK